MVEVKIYLQVDRIQAEIKQLQRNSEESATVSDKLNREVLDVEAAIQQRKSEVKKFSVLVLSRPISVAFLICTSGKEFHSQAGSVNFVSNFFSRWRN